MTQTLDIWNVDADAVSAPMQQAAQAFGTRLRPARAEDLPPDGSPAAIRTGRLTDAEQVTALARWIERRRAAGPLALVVDLVPGLDPEVLGRLRADLLPRASMVCAARREAMALLGKGTHPSDAALPALARRLQDDTGAAVCLSPDPPGDGALRLQAIATPHATGWLALPQAPAPEPGATSSALAGALGLGFVAADAAVLAQRVTSHRGTLLPQMTLDDTRPDRYAPPRARGAPIGLYAIVDSAERVQRVLAAGVRHVQLRIKADAGPDAARLRGELARAAAAAHQAGGCLWVNDHWALALELGAGGVHLGQEDLLALAAPDRARLLGSGLPLGISSHSLWELARAAALAPAYIACGPVWPTLTKRMPWRAQGLDNLAWWCAAAPAPVVAIGGILTPDQAAQAARCGPDGVCVVRGLGDDPAATVPAFAQAIERPGGERAAVPAWPHPSLEI